MKKSMFRFVVPFACALIFCSCEDKIVEPSLVTFVTVVNDSQHKVSVTITDDGDIPDFTLLPDDRLETSYSGLGVFIDEAIVVYDDEVTIIHTRLDDSGRHFKNICNTDNWDMVGRKEGKGYKNYCTFIFDDSDYMDAVELNISGN